MFVINKFKKFCSENYQSAPKSKRNMFYLLSRAAADLQALVSLTKGYAMLSHLTTLSASACKQTEESNERKIASFAIRIKLSSYCLVVIAYIKKKIFPWRNSAEVVPSRQHRFEDAYFAFFTYLLSFQFSQKLKNWQSNS